MFGELLWAVGLFFVAGLFGYVSLFILATIVLALFGFGIDLLKRKER